MVWYVIIIVVFFGMLIIPLRSRWYMGCGLGFLGAILASGAAFGAGWYYVTYCFVKPRPRHDMDFGGLETPLICLVLIPAGSVLLRLPAWYWMCRSGSRIASRQVFIETRIA